MSTRKNTRQARATQPAERSAVVSGEPPRVYSYVRMSTPEQRKGHSFQRQTEAAQRWADARGMVLDTSLSLNDEGVSAFRGDNFTTGALGKFVEHVRSGDVPQGSMLIVENYDRLSRQSPWDATQTLRNIVEAGVAVVIGDGEPLTRESVRADGGMALMMATVTFMRAHDESAAKSRRLKAVWNAKRDRAREDGKALTGRCPAWLRKDGNGYKPVPTRVAIVRRIFKMAKDGVGLEAIARKLVADGVSTWGGSQVWRRSSVYRILTNPAVAGICQPYEVAVVDGHKVRRPIGEPLLDYFPSVLSPEDWEAAQLQRGTRATMPGGKEARNIMGGLLRCALCGGGITRRWKGARSLAKLVCENTQHKRCVAPPLTYDVFESKLLGSLPSLLSAIHLLTHAPVAADLDVAQAEVEAADTAIKRVLTAIERGGEITALTDRLSALQLERDGLVKRVGELRQELAKYSSPGFLKVANWLASADLLADRAATATALRYAVRAVKLDTKAGAAEIEWRSGANSLLTLS